MLYPLSYEGGERRPTEAAGRTVQGNGCAKPAEQSTRTRPDGPPLRRTSAYGRRVWISLQR